jgi:phosphotransferase system enzyme I (PtsI)
VLEATSYMAVDPGMMDLAISGVVERNLSAARAVFEAANTFRDMLAAAGGYIGARVADIEDVRDRIVAAVLGVPMPGIPDPGHPFILVARDLAPADTATVDPEKVLGFVTTEGGPTSHTAILARTLGVPAVVAASGALSVAEGTTSCSTAAPGTVDIAPNDAAVQDAEKRMAARRGAKRRVERRGRHVRRPPDPAAGQRRRPEERAGRGGAGAEGVGLFRTEFLFLDSAKEPTVAEQEEAYAGVFAAFPDGKKVVVRTLDAGADKPLAFLDQGEEPNPALGCAGRPGGVRGVGDPGPPAAGHLPRRGAQLVRRVGDGPDDRAGQRGRVVLRQGPGARPQDARGHGRGTGGRAERRADPRGDGVRQHRHQRPAQYTLAADRMAGRSPR